MFIWIIVNIQKIRKKPKMVNFDNFFAVFSVQCKRNVLIHFSSCQTSPGTSLESPNHIHASIFENLPFWASFGHLWACTGHLEPNHLLLVLYTCVRRCLTRFLRIHVDMFIQFIVNPIMSEKQQKWSILTTFLTFSQFNIIELSWFIFHLVRHLLGQV